MANASILLEKKGLSFFSADVKSVHAGYNQLSLPIL